MSSFHSLQDLLSSFHSGAPLTPAELELALTPSELELVQKGFDANPLLVICYLCVRDFARQFLGRVHHICTNDFLSRTGAVVWTDHGLQHSIRIWKHISALLQLESCKHVTIENKYALACAALLHDVGMFFRHPDFLDLAVQRKYHGKVARYVLPTVESYIDRTLESRSELKSCREGGVQVFQEIKNLVAEICELHQSKVKQLKFSKDGEKACILGNLLLMADALDVCQDRVRSGKSVLDLVESATGISRMSSDQWWVNDCVKETRVVPQSGTNDFLVSVQISRPALQEWYRKATGAKRGPTSQNAHTLVHHLHDYLERYLGEHRDAAQERKADQFGNISWEFSLQGNVLVSDTAADAPYAKVGQIWTDHLADYGLDALVTTHLEPMKNGLDADGVYLFVFDAPSDSIRYLPGQAIFTMNALHDKARRALHKQRIPNKCGIIGHVAYCGTPALVRNLEYDPRRCYSDEDKHIGLGSVIFSPIVDETTDRTTGKTTRTLWAVVMANRKICRGNTKFSENDRDKLNSLMSIHVQPIATHLKQFST